MVDMVVQTDYFSCFACMTWITKYLNYYAYLSLVNPQPYYFLKGMQGFVNTVIAINRMSFVTELIAESTPQ